MLAKLLKVTKAHKDDQVRRGMAASELIENPMFVEAIETIENRYFNAFYRSKLEDKEKREEAYVALKVCEEIKLHLSSIVKSGKFKAN